MKYKCNNCGVLVPEENTTFSTTYRGTRTEYGMQVEPDETVMVCPECGAELEDAEEWDDCPDCGESFAISEMVKNDWGSLVCKKCKGDEK